MIFGPEGDASVAVTTSGRAYSGSVDSQSHVLQLNVAVVTLFRVGTLVRSGPPECDPGTEPLYVTVALDECLFDDHVGTTAFRMQMGPGFDVAADDRGPCDVQPLVGPLDLAARASIHWGEMAAFNPPDPDAAR